MSNPIDDFPVYANDENKKLHEVIQQKNQLTNEIKIKIESEKERFNVLNDHKTSVEQELKHTEESKRQKETELKEEDHLTMINDREIGRMKNDMTNMDERESEMQDRLNNIQASICTCNSKMD